jgi:hypothetical protein
VLLKWARLARLPANQAEESTIASAPFSAEFGTLVVIHEPELRDVVGVTVAAEQHASAGGTFVPILMDSCCLEFGRSISSTPR